MVMFKTIAGIGLLVVGVFIFFVLLMSGMLGFPHVIGPIVLVGTGVILLLYRGKAKEFQTN
jgi:hypothetical protein